MTSAGGAGRFAAAIAAAGTATASAAAASVGSSAAAAGSGSGSGGSDSKAAAAAAAAASAAAYDPTYDPKNARGLDADDEFDAADAALVRRHPEMDVYRPHTALDDDDDDDDEVYAVAGPNAGRSMTPTAAKHKPMTFNTPPAHAAAGGGGGGGDVKGVGGVGVRPKSTTPPRDAFGVAAAAATRAGGGGGLAPAAGRPMTAFGTFGGFGGGGADFGGAMGMPYGGVPGLSRQRSHSQSPPPGERYGLDVPNNKPKKQQHEQNVQVVCRFRPESEQEIKSGTPMCVEFPHTPGGGADVGDAVKLTNSIDGGGRTYNFAFDRIFQPYATQEEVYERVGQPVVDSVLAGYNSALIAYGQTGSGKTYTMLGPGFDGLIGGDEKKPQADMVLTEPGVIPRVVQSLFTSISAIESDQIEFTVRASYIQIYQELVKDLLAPSNQSEKEGMKIRADSQRGLWLPDATEAPVYSLMQVFAVLRTGARNRAVAKTKANEHSSRSHALLILTVQRRDTVAKTTKLSQLYLVDLAGSEKVSKTDVQGKQLAEAKLINKSLLALGQVISALAALSEKPRGKKRDAAAATAHIPYRDSKLTRLLQNCLGGNARTTLIICCSPSAYNAQETLSTLRFGDRSKRIRNRAVVNEEIGVDELKRLLKRSEEDNRRLRGVLKQLEAELKVMQQLTQFGAYQHAIQQSLDRSGSGSSSSSGSRAVEALPAPAPAAAAAAAAAADTKAVVVAATVSGGGANPMAVAGAGGGGCAPAAVARTAAAAAVSNSTDGRATGRPELERVHSDDDGYSDANTAGNDGDVRRELPHDPHNKQTNASVSLVRREQLASVADHVHAMTRAGAGTGASGGGALTIGAAGGGGGDLRQLVISFLCPLSRVVMHDPVVAMDGWTYERRAIQLYLKSNRGSWSPMTGAKLSAKLLVPNHNLQQQIRKFYPNAPRAHTVSPFALLPLPLVTHVLSFLDHKALCRCVSVSTEFQTLALDKQLWRGLLARRLGVLQPKLTRELPTYAVVFKVTYRERHPPAAAAAAAARDKSQPKLGVKLIPPPKRPGITIDD